MNLTFTHHALQRMAQRRITEEEVRQTVGEPDAEIPTGGRLVMVKYLRGRRLEVITVQENNELIIITTYYAS